MPATGPVAPVRRDPLPRVAALAAALLVHALPVLLLWQARTVAVVEEPALSVQAILPAPGLDNDDVTAPPYLIDISALTVTPVWPELRWQIGNTEESPSVAPAADTATASTSPSAPAAAPDSPRALTPPRFEASYLDNPEPEYPMLSRRRQEEGVVLLRVLVSASGSPVQVTIDRSSGFERLDKAAVETVRRWRFVPARIGTEPVEAWVIVPVEFSLS